MRLILATLFTLLLSALVQAGGNCYSCGSYSYSQSYAPSYSNGYEYWPGGYWRGAYYSPGYYPASNYYQPTINVAAFIPYLAYQPVGVSTYQPVAAAPALVPNAIAPVAQAVQAAPAKDYCKEHTAGLEKRIAFMEQLIINAGKGQSEQPPAPQPQPQPLPQKAPQQAPQQAPPMPPAQEPQSSADSPGLSVAVNKCGSCHEKAEAAKMVAKDGKTFMKGGGLVMLSNGVFQQPDPTTTVKYTRKLLTGKMPPADAPQLTEQEKPALIQLILEGK